MKPDKQAVPEVPANITPASKTRQVESWLAGLPYHDATASARLLADYLSLHDRDDLPAGFRRQLYDLVMVASRRILDLMVLEFRDMPLPMDPRQFGHVELALRLAGTAAAFSHRLARECIGRSPPLFGENPLPGHLGRFLRAQREIMALCHLCHRQLPEGFWQATHEAGLLLHQFGLVAASDAGPPAMTLGDLYLAVLLEATADPYHFSEQERQWAMDMIARHGRLALVGPAREQTHGGVFGILAHEDKPPHPLSWQQDAEPNCDLVLNTAPLVRKLALLISQLERDQAPSGEAPVVRHPAYRELLRRLKSTWSGASQRTAARHRPARPSQRKVCVGFYAIHRQFAGHPEPGDAHVVMQCQLVNESLGGLALSVARPTTRLRIGGLVCVSRGGGDVWSDIGLVRWFKTAADGTLTFGIKYLNGRMAAGFWSLPGEEPLYPCLLAEFDQDQPVVPRYLLTPALRLDPLASLDVRLGERSLPVRLLGKVEPLPEIDLFRYTLGRG